MRAGPVKEGTMTRVRVAAVLAVLLMAGWSQAAMINVALSSNGGVASAASPDASGYGTLPGNAIDGNRDGVYGNGSIWHSAWNQPQWLEVQFNNVYSISQINIFSRTDGSTPIAPCYLKIFNGADLVVNQEVNAFTATITGTSLQTGGSYAGMQINFGNVLGDRVRYESACGSLVAVAEMEVLTPEPVTLALLAAGSLAAVRRRAR